jgi:threonine synthase
MDEEEPIFSAKPSDAASGRRVWVKLCGFLHTGSVKDLGMTVLVSMVRQMIANGKQIRAVGCASTGDTSAALAAYAAAAGIPAIVVLPRGKVTVAQLVQPLANGALVFAVDTDFDGCMAIIQKLATDEGLYLANSMNSLRIEGQKTASIEIAHHFDWQVPDVVIIRVGTREHRCLCRRIRMMRELGLVARVLRPAAQPRPRTLYLASRNDGDSARSRRNPPWRPPFRLAIRFGQQGDCALKRCGGMVEQASEQELADAVARGDARACCVPAHRCRAGRAHQLAKRETSGVTSGSSSFPPRRPKFADSWRITTPGGWRVARRRPTG